MDKFVKAVMRMLFDTSPAAILTCPRTGSRLRREETAGLTQGGLNDVCAFRCSTSKKACNLGCTRTPESRWAFEGRTSKRDQ